MFLMLNLYYQNVVSIRFRTFTGILSNTQTRGLSENRRFTLVDVKIHAFATNNQSILLGNKVAWISKILMRLVFGTKSCGFFLNSRFSLLTIRILPRVGPEVSEVSVARGLYISLFTFFQPIRESLLENEGISLAEIFHVKIKTKNRL